MAIGQVTLVKGETILSELGWVKYKKGIAGVNDVLEDINRDRPKNLQVSLNDFQQNGWYPVELQQSVLASIVTRYGGGDPDIIREVGAHGVKRIAQFKFVLRFMNVKKVAEKMADNLMVLYRTVELRTRDIDEKEMEVSVIGFPDDPVYTKLMQGGTEQLMSYLNLKSYSVTGEGSRISGDIGLILLTLKWE